MNRKSKLVLAAAIGLLASGGAVSIGQGAGDAEKKPASASLEETRLKMGKWIETQQIISKERKDWQQGKEILLGRLELVKQEVATLEEKIKQAQASVAEATR